MSGSLRDREPLPTGEVRKLLREIVAAGGVAFSTHARQRMEERGLTAPDAENALRAGAVQTGELERGTWRYRVCTPRSFFIVAFRSNDEVVVVRAGRP